LQTLVPDVRPRHMSNLIPNSEHCSTQNVVDPRPQANVTLLASDCVLAGPMPGKKTVLLLTIHEHGARG
jgi:hypothetical protein